MAPIVVLVALGFTLAIKAEVVPEKVEAALNELRSDQWELRVQGFYDLVHAGLGSDKQSKFPVADATLAIASSNPAMRQELLSTLNSLLEKENAFVASGNAPATEEFYTYYGDVIYAVSTLRDASSAKVLFDAINTGGMAINALAGFGDKALSLALDKLQSPNDETRHNICQMLSAMTEPQNMKRLQKPESPSLLLSALLAGAKDKNAWTRAVAADGLGSIGTPEAVQALLKLASSDPFVTPNELGGVRYPVREAADKALKNLTK